MSINQSGKEPVAVTTEGTPRDVSESGTPNNFNKNASSEAQKGGDRNFNGESRRQPTEPPSATPPDAPHLRSRPQQAGSPAARVDPKSIPEGGTVPPMSTAMRPGIQPASGARSPFKNMK